MDTSAVRYLAYLIHGYYDNLLTLMRLEGVSDQELDSLYALGYNLFTYGNYEACREIFQNLTAYAPYEGYFWRALGAVNQQLKDYPQAIAAYDMAIANDESDVVSYVYRGESQILSGDVQAGLQDFEQVLSIGADVPQHQPWVQRSKLLLRVHRQAE
jgi:type III secretion system low calcium response chaperone LcrH/SycD